jgi:hypothetical protein
MYQTLFAISIYKLLGKSAKRQDIKTDMKQYSFSVSRIANR